MGIFLLVLGILIVVGILVATGRIGGNVVRPDIRTDPHTTLPPRELVQDQPTREIDEKDMGENVLSQEYKEVGERLEEEETYLIEEPDTEEPLVAQDEENPIIEERRI